MGQTTDYKPISIPVASREKKRAASIIPSKLAARAVAEKAEKPPLRFRHASKKNPRIYRGQPGLYEMA